MARAAIGVGANLGDAAATVRAAIAALASLGAVVARSSLYRTPPWGVRDQPPFVNAAAVLETQLDPRALLAELKRIERELGRVASFRWGPRAVDLDILTYDDRVVTGDDLTIPHPRMRERAFVLVPLAEIDPRYERAVDQLDPAERRAVVRLTEP